MGFDWVERERPHAVCIPYPSQGHLTPLLQLAKLLNARGFHITYVNTEFNHNRLLRSRGPDSVKGLDDFRFEAIPDGLPPSDRDATQDVPALSDSTTKNCTVPFLHLITRLNASPNIPPVTCIVSDGVMTFTLDAAEELGIPAVLFWTPRACGFLGYLQYQFLLDRSMVPLKGTIATNALLSILRFNLLLIKYSGLLSKYKTRFFLLIFNRYSPFQL